MSTIGFIGAGHIAGQVAAAALSAGHAVIMSNSRGPESLADLVKELGPAARAATVEEAAADSDTIVVAAPLRAFSNLPMAAIGDKVLVVTTNYNIDGEGHIARVDEGAITVPGILQEQLPTARVVRGFSHISWTEVVTDGSPSGTPGRRALALAGDDPAARHVVANLYDELGFDALDLGALDEGWRIDRGQSAFGVRMNLEELRASVVAADRSKSGY